MINEKTKLSQILELKGAEEILQKFEVPCLTCPMMQVEMDTLTIGEIAKMYALDLDGILEALNQIENN